MNKRVLILVNHEIVIYNFRKELVKELLDKNYEVYLSSPKGEKIDLLVELGVKHINTTINRHGVNIIQDLKLLRFYSRIIKDIKPLVILTYTIKPNIYGGIAAKKHRVPYIANITGLGTAVEHQGILQWITVHLYKYAFTKINTVFFQNEENMNFFVKKKIARLKHKLVPGSGVNLNEFQYIEYPSDENINFAFISRIMKEKGIDEYLISAKNISASFPNVVFHICGFLEQEYESKLKEYDDIVIYHGMVEDIRTIYSKIHCTVLPSYYPEGMSNVLLESSACGRPIITSNRSGCREVVEDGKTGFIVEAKNPIQLTNSMIKFINLSIESKKLMGENARAKMVRQFDRRIVVKSYLDTIFDIEEGNKN